MVRTLTSPTPLLRVEGGVLLGLGLLLYWKVGGNWLALIALLLVPELSMLGYLGGNRTGGATYNLAHLYLGPGLLAAVGAAGGSDALLALALTWFSHINLDRMLGYGLKLPTAFKDTHLNSVDSAANPPATSAECVSP